MLQLRREELQVATMTGVDELSFSRLRSLFFYVVNVPLQCNILITASDLTRVLVLWRPSAVRFATLPIRVRKSTQTIALSVFSVFSRSCSAQMSTEIWRKQMAALNRIGEE